MTAIQIDLIRQTEAARALIHACRDDLDGDEQATADMVEGSTDLMEAIDGALSRMADIDALSEGLAEKMTEMSLRKHRLETQRDRIKSMIMSALKIINQRKLERPLATLSIRSTPPAVDITDENSIPDSFKVPQPPKISKTAIKEALQAGATVPGATLKPAGTTLAISTR